MTTLYMLTSQSQVQMMSFIVKSGERLIVIDGGNLCDGNYLCDYISKLGCVVDAWYFTHAHSDHIGALTSILERRPGDLEIREVCFNFPSEEFIRDCGESEFYHYEKLMSALREHNLKLRTVHAGDVDDYGTMTVRVLREPDESIREGCKINNSSVVYRLEAEHKSILFLGDLGEAGGKQLLERVPHELIRADYVQMAHHGQQGVGKEVYEVARPDYCLWCTPDWLWENDAGKGYDTHIWRTVVTRGWISEIGVKWHYISKDGTHEIPLSEGN